MKAVKTASELIIENSLLSPRFQFWFISQGRSSMLLYWRLDYENIKNSKYRGKGKRNTSPESNVEEDLGATYWWDRLYRFYGHF